MEGGQWLGNVDWTHLVLASGKLVLPKRTSLSEEKNSTFSQPALHWLFFLCPDLKRIDEAIDLRTSEEITEIEVSKEKVTKSQFKVSSISIRFSRKIPFFNLSHNRFLNLVLMIKSPGLKHHQLQWYILRQCQSELYKVGKGSYIQKPWTTVSSLNMITAQLEVVKIDFQTKRLLTPFDCSSRSIL